MAYGCVIGWQSRLGSSFLLSCQGVNLAGYTYSVNALGYLAMASLSGAERRGSNYPEVGCSGDERYRRG